MKSVIRLALTFVVMCTFVPVATASASVRPTAAKQKIQITSISEHCLDEFDEEDIIYIVEGAKVCNVSVRVQGRGSTKSKIALEYYNSDDGWTRSDWKVQTTTTAGRASFKLTVSFPNQSDDFCYEGDSYTHRFSVARAGRHKSFRSSSFEISYTSAENNPACLGSDSEDDYEYE
jgi:hypothetical protein